MNELFKNNIKLNKEEHIYKLDDSPHLNFDSVTTFIGSFFEEFDAPKIAKNLEGKGRYQDMTAQDLIDSWKKAADYGTLVHEELENYINFKTPVKEKKSFQGIEWLKQYIMKSDFEIYSEAIVYSKELRLAGTIDLLLLDKINGTYNILDWKTSKNIYHSAFKNKKGNHEISARIPDCNFNHYALQLSLYRYILENYYNLKISEHIIIHLMDEECIGYHAPYMQDQIIAMINNRKEFDSEL